MKVPTVLNCASGVSVAAVSLPQQGQAGADLVDPAQGRHVHSLPPDGTGTADASGVLTGAAVDDCIHQHLEGVLQGNRAQTQHRTAQHTHRPDKDSVEPSKFSSESAILFANSKDGLWNDTLIIALNSYNKSAHSVGNSSQLYTADLEQLDNDCT